MKKIVLNKFVQDRRTNEYTFLNYKSLRKSDAAHEKHLVHEQFYSIADVQMVDVSLLISGVMGRLTVLMVLMNSSVQGGNANRYDL